MAGRTCHGRIVWAWPRNWAPGRSPRLGAGLSLFGSRRQDRGSRVPKVVTGSTVLKEELSAVGHVVPDAGQIGCGRFRMCQGLRNRVFELGLQFIHFVEIQHIRADDRCQHRPSLIKGVGPGARFDAGRHNLSQGFNRTDNVRNPVCDAFAIVCSPSPKCEIQTSPAGEDDNGSHDHEPPT
jgi:hypothetical protein